MKQPRGTRDFGPEQMAVRRQVERRLRRAFESYGFQEMQTPTFESLELFTAKSGPAIVEELYQFEDKSGRRLALRPEITAPVMRHYFSSMKMAPKPVKVYYVANCFRYDRPQAGRYREFWQMGCEVIGDDTPTASAELVALAAGLAKQAGLREYRVRVGHLEILRSLVEDAGVARADQAPAMRLIDKGDHDGLRQMLGQGGARLLEALTASSIEEIRPFLSNPAAAAAADALQQLLRTLGTLRVDPRVVSFDASIARGLDYYSGLVFEVDAPGLGAEKQLLGGGSYDLADVFSQPSVAAAGFALGFDRLLVALEAEDALPSVEPPIDVLACALDEAALASVLASAAALRTENARVEVLPSPRPPKKALARAAQIGARFALLVGPEELKDRTVAWKDLDTGQQDAIAAQDLARHWRELA